MLLMALFAAVMSAVAPESAYTRARAQMEALANDEARLVEALRSYQVLQQAMSTWDLVIAEEVGDAEPDLAEEYAAWSAMRRDHIDKLYSAALERYPNNARLLNNYGEFLYDYRDDVAKAIQLWKLSASLDSTLSLPLNNMALYYAHAGDFERGLRYLEQAAELEPDQPDYLFNLAQYYMLYREVAAEIHGWDKERVYKEAMKASKRATELMPNDYDTLQDYAVNFFAAEQFLVEADWPAAAAAWQKAREHAREEDEVFFTWLNEARVWMQKPDPTKARACLEQALAIYPDSEPAQTLMQRLESGATSE